MKKGLLFAVIFGIILILGLGIFFVVKYGVLNSFTGSATYLTVQNVVYNGQNEVMIYGVAGIGANQININVDPSKLNSYLSSSGVQATQGVTGSITLANPTRSFPATVNNGQVFQILSTKDIGFLSNCPTVPSQQLVKEISTGLTKNTCIYVSNYGNDAQFTGQILDSSTVTAQIGSSTGQLNINPLNPQTSITLNDGLTKISWAGNLLNFNQISTPTYDILFSQSQFNGLIEKNAYSDYQSYSSITFNCIQSKMNLITGIYDYNGVQNCVTNFNNYMYQTVLKDHTFDYINNVGAQSGAFQTQSSSSVYFNVLLNNPSTFPTFVIILPATSVGIQPLSGTPSIVQCISNLNIGSGDSQTVSAQIKNTGNQAGEFTAQITCNGNVNGISNTQLVSAGQTANMPITVSGVNTVSGTQNNGCTLKVTDTNSQKSVSCNFNVAVSYRQNVICTPNSVYCLNATALATCNSDGSAYSLQLCPSGQQCIAYTNGTSQCVTPSSNNQCSIFQHYVPPYKILGFIPAGDYCALNTGWWIVIIVGVLAVVIFVIVMVRRLSQK